MTLQPEDYDQLMDDAFAHRSRKLLNRIKGGYMPFELHVVVVDRLLIKSNAETREEALAKWREGIIIDRTEVSSEVLFYKKVA